MTNWEFPYPSRRMPVFADNIVATSQPLAAQAGVEMLRIGGNAVDAALAAAIALTVVEPTSNGIGGDAFAQVWDGEQLHGLNASGRSPRDWDPGHLIGRRAMPLEGWDTVTVPGAVSAWVALARRFGSLPFARVFEPAIRYAADGFPVSPVTALAWQRARDRFGPSGPFADVFLPGGRAPAVGERWSSPDHARTLQAIAQTEGAAFYHGELADRMVAFAQAGGGSLRHVDLREHRPEWVTPLELPFGGLEVHELPPNGQGLAALIALGILAHTPLRAAAPDSAESLHWQIEAMKLGLADIHREVADPRAMHTDPGVLLDDGYLRDRARCIDPRRAQVFGPGPRQGGGTVYLAAGDASGRAVSFIQSNFHGFGSGLVVPGTGIALHNRGAGFSTEPGHPNVAAPGKRPFHTIIPGFATHDGRAAAAFGVMGGPMQPQGHVQLLVRSLLYGQNPQAASDAPRWQVLSGLRVALEEGPPPAAVDGLRERGHEVGVHPVGPSGAAFGFGGAQVVWRVPGGWLGASDHRKDGQAVGW